MLCLRWIAIAVTALGGCLEDASPGAVGADVRDTTAAETSTEDASSCSPGATRCVGARAERCDASGAWGAAEVCAVPERCVDGACVTGGCSGTGLACEGDGAVFCSDGEPFASADCARWGRICDVGACREVVCTPGASRCAGGLVATCNPTGTYEALTPCDPGDVCVVDDGGALCIPGACVPGQTACVGVALATCVASDEPLAVTPCEAGTHCSSGRCVSDLACDAPTIAASAGPVAAPGTALHLSTDRAELSHRWSASTSPAGATVVFTPSAFASAPTVRLEVVGRYRLEVETIAPNGQPCGTAILEVEVVPDAPLYVELLWDTAGDLDQTDEGPDAGADLDLHVVTPSEAGGANGVDLLPLLFEQPWDTYWMNPSPRSPPWSPVVDHDVRLRRDDTDGAGPEAALAMLPHVGADYLIAVHQWSDHGYGPSVATLRVYVYGALALEASRGLVSLDLWPAAVVRWPSGEARLVGACGADGPLCVGDTGCASGEPCVPITEPGFVPPDFAP